MKKTPLITLLTASLASLFVVACGSGSSNSSATNPPATTATPAPIPAGYTPIGSKPAPIAIDEAATSIAVPIDGTFQTLTIPAEVTAAIIAAGVSSVVTASDGQNILLTIPASASTSEKQITYVLTAAAATQSVATQAASTDLNAVAYDTTGAVTNIVAVPATGATPAGVYFATSSAIVVQPPLTSPVTPAFTRPISDCSATGTSTAVQYANYSGQGYFGVGTSTGSVCVLNGTSSTSGLTFTNLSSQAGSRYVGGSVISFSFSVNGGTLYGYWFENVNGTPTVYRVTANSSIVAQSFWNVTSSQPQTNSSGTTVVFGNVPASVNAMYSDSSNNLYLGTNSGSVYKLASGFSTYTSSQLASATGAVFLAPTNTLVGTSATTLIGGAVSAFSVN